MTYTKPQLVGYSAMAVIQSSHKNGMNNELGVDVRTIPAYEADE